MSRIGYKPNVASWFMWGVGGVTELIIYAALVNNAAKEILPAVCAVVAVVTFLRVWWREDSFHLDRKDWVIVALDVVLVAFWFITRNPFASNVLLGFDMLLSFLPILRSTWNNPRSEHPTPWRTWTIAYGLLTLVVILRWENVWELIYPVLYLVLHALVWGIARFRRLQAADL
jgi:hypothetical protein